MNKHNNYALLITKMITIFAVLVTVVIAVNLTKKDTPKSDEPIGNVPVSNLPCREGLPGGVLAEASVALDPKHPENISNLGPISDRIMNLENFQDDTNCLNIITTRYVYSSDYKTAKVYLDLLTQKSTAGNGTQLSNNLLSLDELKNNVEFLSRKIDEIERNNPYGPAI